MEGEAEMSVDEAGEEKSVLGCRLGRSARESLAERKRRERTSDNQRSETLEPAQKNREILKNDEPSQLISRPLELGLLVRLDRLCPFLCQLRAISRDREQEVTHGQEGSQPIPDSQPRQPSLASSPPEILSQPVSQLDPG